MAIDCRAVQLASVAYSAWRMQIFAATIEQLLAGCTKQTLAHFEIICTHTVKCFVVLAFMLLLLLFLLLELLLMLLLLLLFLFYCKCSRWVLSYLLTRHLLFCCIIVVCVCCCCWCYCCCCYCSCCCCIVGIVKWHILHLQ